MFRHEDIDQVVNFFSGRNGFGDRDVRSLNTTVEGPIGRHKSRLASRETDDGLTDTYSGVRSYGTETAEMVATAPSAFRPERGISMGQSHDLMNPLPLCPEMYLMSSNHINA